MYRTYCPFDIFSTHYDPEKSLAALTAAQSDCAVLSVERVPAAGFSPEQLRKITENVAFFRAHGIETVLWIWSLMVSDRPDLTPLKGVGGKESKLEKCPADEKFLSFFAGQIRALASCHPDRILLDDDLRLTEQDSGFGCVCERHLAAAEQILGKPIPREDLIGLLFGGTPNEYRSALMKAWGDSLRGYARRLREAVDSVDPSVRLGQCACLGTFDADGTDSFELSKLLAGNTKPFLRLIGAPYWEWRRSWGCRLPDIIELERMERSWYAGNDIEIFAEGDTYPRPRWKVPAAWLEIFDSALQADGTLDGILKYLFDYSASLAYEPVYLQRHRKNLPLNAEIRRIFDGKTAQGIRVWSPMKKVERSDYSGCPVDEKYLNRRFFSLAARSLASAAIPTTYSGTGCAGIAYGEEARSLPAQAFEKPLILDLSAAKILTGQGIDVGLSSVGEPLAARYLHYAPKDTGVVLFARAVPSFAAVTPADGAQVRATFTADGDEKEYPWFFTYENAAGQRFGVYCHDADAADEEVRRNYLHPQILHDTLSAWGSPLPVRATGNPDLYVLCKTGDGQTAVGLWNVCPDALEDAVLTLPEAGKTAEFIGCTGRIDGTKIVIDRIAAFEYGAVLIRT